MVLGLNLLKNKKEKEYNFKCSICKDKATIKTFTDAVELLGTRCKKCKKGYYQPTEINKGS